MKSIFRISLFTVFFSFLFGFYWSYFLDGGSRNFKKENLNILIPKFISHSNLDSKVISTTNFNIRIHLYSNYENLNQLLAKPQFHGVIVPSFLIKKMIGNKLLHPIPEKMRFLLNSVTVDFKDLEFDPSNTYTLPLFWGVDGIYSKATDDNKNNDTTYFLNYFGHISKKAVSNKNEKIKTFYLTQLPQLLKNKEFNSFQAPYSFKSRLKDQVESLSVSQERDQLWVYSFAIPKYHLTANKTTQWLNQLIKHSWSSVIEETQLSSTLDSNTSNLPNILRPQGIRSLELSKIGLKSTSSKDVLLQDSYFSKFKEPKN